MAFSCQPRKRERVALLIAFALIAHDLSAASMQDAPARPLAAIENNFPTLSHDQVQRDLAELNVALLDRFSYLTLRDVDHRAHLAAIERSCPEGMRVDELALAIQQLMRRFGDGHASVERLESYLPRGCLPFLLGDVGDSEGRLVAFREDRSGFFDPERPYLVSIDGVTVAAWIESAETIAPGGSSQWVRRNAVRNLRLIGFLSVIRTGRLSSHAFIELTDQTGADAVTLRVPLADRKPIYGEWPRRDTGWIEDDIGYLRLPRMDGGAAEHVRASMEQFRDATGLIIDVRGNTGGSRHALIALMPYLMPPDAPPRVVNAARYRLSDAFEDDHLESRYLYRRDHPSHSSDARDAIDVFHAAFEPEFAVPDDQFSDWHYFVIDRAAAPQGVYHFDRPVVVLMNEDCFSATDIFLGALKGIDNVTLIGTASGGGSGRTTDVELPESGIEVRLSSMVSYRPDGRLYDGWGIEPDLEVQCGPEFLIGESDKVLERAVEFIEEQSCCDS